MPAIHTGLSVSRVGGKTQAPVSRKVAETLRLDYAQFLELEVFTRFGASLDARVQAKIVRGERIRAILAQTQYAGLALANQVALLFALQRGMLDKMEADKIAAFKNSLSEWLAGPGKLIVDAAASGALPNEQSLNTCFQSLQTLASSCAEDRQA